ncbi:cytochrome c3 family protein [Geomobilimonas luticola]|uniref:Doubled CXXCH motif domain-containing protein n=1 Tax=Geomobilimonas luticola TaxID=1114878 RepID=A0ABS5SAM5_9BACT|nr:cytochrome c3 family protein [Geomobilimonas luticola]MBT0652416.1 hypothetical protein [Geomobilimonas luticola]
MVNNHHVVNWFRKGLVAASICSAALLAVVADSGQVTAESTSNSMCDYAVYLGETGPREKFLTMRDEMHRAAQERATSDERFRINLSIFPGGKQERQIDSVSQGCLGCHDEKGVVVNGGPGLPAGVVNAEMAKMSSNHPIGMDYEAASLLKKNLHSAAELPQNMVLVEGKLSCITCHDPLNRESKHLAVGSNRSILCFACHNM